MSINSFQPCTCFLPENDTNTQFVTTLFIPLRSKISEHAEVVFYLSFITAYTFIRF